MKTKYKGMRYKIEEILLGGERMYVVARNDGRTVYMAYTSLEQAMEQIKSMEDGSYDR